MTSKLTREEMQELISALRLTPTSTVNGISLGRLADALSENEAAMDSEPVGYFGRFDPDDEDLIDQCSKNVKGAFPLYRHAQPAPVVVPEGLNPETADLVLRFASALADKLYKAEQKYGRSTDWMKDDWYDDCLQSLWEHIEKGDPRDAAAYCAFMWYHGWVTTDYDRNVQNACRAAMLHGAENAESRCGNSPVIPDGYVMVPKEPTEAMMLHNSGCQHHAWDDPDCAMRQTRRLIWSHMLAAAPQEDKP